MHPADLQPAYFVAGQSEKREGSGHIQVGDLVGDVDCGDTVGSASVGELEGDCVGALLDGATEGICVIVNVGAGDGDEDGELKLGADDGPALEGA